MKCRATVSFTGAITMSQNEVKEVNDEIAKDLVECGYLECMTDISANAVVFSTEGGTTGTQEGDTTSAPVTTQEKKTKKDPVTTQEKIQTTETQDKKASKPKPAK